MKYTFGPVRSRRFGWSLGIDIMPKLKTCTYDCVYCELGKTSMSGKAGINYRCAMSPNFKEDLSSELREKLVDCASYVNAITFGYNGEPTLNENLGYILESVRKIRFEVGIRKVPITILTNSSTLGDPQIRNALLNFDLVIAKLDVGTPELFNAVNRPHHTVPSIERIMENIKLLKTEMKKENKLYIQTLLFKVRSPTSLKSNATNENVLKIAKMVNEIHPDQIQVYTIARPPAEPKVTPLSKLELVKLSDLMAESIEAPTEVFHFY